MSMRGEFMKILLADHRLPFLRSLRMLLELDNSIKVVGEARSRSEVMALVEQERPDLIIMSASLRGRSTLEIAKMVKNSFPGIKIVILSRFEHNIYVNYAFKCGASGYVYKDSVYDELLPALADVKEGRSYISSAMLQPLEA
jgi:DNA-binding NarL/FixJ family response regulator